MFNRASVISWLFALTFVAQSSFAANLPDFAELAEKTVHQWSISVLVMT